MIKKVILVTGASRGLGKNLAQALAKEGHIVYSGVRNIKKAPKNTIGIRLDLKCEKSLKRCVQQIIKTHHKIDMLINNAGIAYDCGVDCLKMTEIKELFEVNFFGAFRLTQLVLPYMRQKRNGRILFISSIRGIENFAYMGAYSASKAALEAIAFDWAVTLSKWNITISVVQPGPMATGIKIKNGHYYKKSQNPYLPYEPIKINWNSVEDVTQSILHHLNDKKAPFRFQPDEFSRKTISKHLVDPSGMKWVNIQKSLFNKNKDN